ncbi:hypothetical protein QUB56_29050 [Microcoleus sp. AR_TQ3_B6]|uniref:hypothetical protein n=1 Tax=Microcoleus sp. AR_TQ3_B6 TaxID=3055284 RepID=UPI002FD2714D
MLVPWGVHQYLVGNGAGCPRPRTSGGAPHILLWLAHYPGRQIPVLADLQVGRMGRAAA